MVIFCKEIYFVSYQQIETLDSDKIVNEMKMHMHL